ncbi:recombinase family protein, partial [Klebsiella pneumoniae]|uniref:recombinase family protein n=1 Tax=Klebsiella pneumoniae TaxID=573 RepID=UPI001F4BCB74
FCLGTHNPPLVTPFSLNPSWWLNFGLCAPLSSRVSARDQSCDRQEFDLRAFAGCAGYDVVGIFKETGSGTKLDRAERKKVLALAQSRHILLYTSEAAADLTPVDLVRQ